MNFKNITAAATFLLFVGGCVSNSEGPVVAKKDVLFENLDTSARPGADFFQYANGGWINKNPIPGDQSSWGIGHLVLEENMKRLREISEKAAASNGARGSAEQKIGDFWATAMDSTAIETAGLRPIQPLLDKVNGIQDTRSLISTVAG